MQFNLPENLKHQLVSYDPVLKQAVKVRKNSNPNAKPRKKSEFPLGKVENLIPTNIVPAKDQLVAVQHINAADVVHRARYFTKRVLEKEAGDGTKFYKEEVIAILYHYESAWHAAWIPQGADVGKYLYGFTVAFKEGVKATERARLLCLHHKDMVHIEQQDVQFGRSKFRLFTHKVTTDDIEKDLCHKECWNLGGAGTYYQKCSFIAPVINKFRDSYLRTVPQWVDAYSIYDRINPKKNSIPAIIKETTDFKNYIADDFHPTVESMLALVNPDLELAVPIDENSLYHHAYNVKGKLKHAGAYKILNTPFFRNWIQSKCDQIINTYGDQSNDRRKKITQGFVQYTRVVQWIKCILTVWPDTPIDLFRVHLQELLFVPNPLNRIPLIRNTEEIQDTETIITWLRKHMPVTSLFKILNTAYNKKMEEIKDYISREDITKANRRFLDDAVGLWTLGSYNNISDTFLMLSSVISKQVEKGEPIIQPPNRWRIMEFHDHVQAESWKLSNENVDLPQDLFPQPVEVEFSGQKWMFFQPVNTHQLAAWGQAVRNCVGSHSNYADGVKKKEHFIVLGMLDGQPRFTIQLRVRDGVMDVVQIKSVSNSSLSSTEESSYAMAFSTALKKRSEELPEAVAEDKVEETLVY